MPRVFNQTIDLEEMNLEVNAILCIVGFMVFYCIYICALLYVDANQRYECKKLDTFSNKHTVIHFRPHSQLLAYNRHS
jgi:hypothetical protein